jgi:hypothetical protein
MDVLLADLDMDSVDFRPTFDASQEEPTVLPAKVRTHASSLGVHACQGCTSPPMSRVPEGLKTDGFWGGGIGKTDARSRILPGSEAIVWGESVNIADNRFSYFSEALVGEADESGRPSSGNPMTWHDPGDTPGTHASSLGVRARVRACVCVCTHGIRASV